MELFKEGETFSNSISRFESQTKQGKFKMEYDIYPTDTIRELLNKIALSCPDKELITGDYIYAFTYEQKISQSKIKELEKKVCPNEKILQLLRKEYSDFSKMNEKNLRKFFQKDEIKEHLASKNLNVLLQRIPNKYKKGLENIDKETVDLSDIIKEGKCISHSFEDVQLKILNDKQCNKLMAPYQGRLPTEGMGENVSLNQPSFL